MDYEQIIQKAHEYAMDECGSEKVPVFLIYKKAFIDGANARDKEIDQLQHELAALSKVKAYALHVGNDVPEDIRIFRMAENYLHEFLCIKMEEDEKNRYNNNMYGIRYESEDITDAYQQGMRDAYENPRSHWISINDRLPDTGDDIIYLMNSGTPGRAQRYKKTDAEWFKMNVRHWQYANDPKKGGK